MMLNMRRGGNIPQGYQRSLDGDIYYGYNLGSYYMIE